MRVLLCNYMNDKKRPYSELGQKLKAAREHSQQSITEVSGAVEIDEGLLKRIEEGLERPEEDILLLLINLFNVQDNEAVSLWRMADYDRAYPGDIKVEDGDGLKPMVMMLALDLRTMYSDGLEVAVNKAGVTLNFLQSSGQSNLPVARVGMSHSQAELVIKTLEQALLRARYLNQTKNLPPSV